MHSLSSYRMSNRPGGVVISTEKTLIYIGLSESPCIIMSFQQLPHPLDVLEGGEAPPMSGKLGKSPKVLKFCSVSRPNNWD